VGGVSVAEKTGRSSSAWTIYIMTALDTGERLGEGTSTGNSSGLAGREIATDYFALIAISAGRDMAGGARMRTGESQTRR
jgi:hypothetical protein